MLTLDYQITVVVGTCSTMSAVFPGQNRRGLLLIPDLFEPRPLSTLLRLALLKDLALQLA